MTPTVELLSADGRLGWKLPERPDRRLLTITLLVLSGSALLFAVLPRVDLSGLLGVVLPSSGEGSVRDILLEEHRLVFGGITAGLLVLVWTLPLWYRLVREVTRALAKPRAWVFLLSLLLLIVVTRIALSGRMLPIVPGQDTGHYFQLASTLLEEGRYIEYASHPGEISGGFRAWRPPGFPFVLAGAMGIAGQGMTAVLLTNLIWAIVLVVSVYFLVRKLGTEEQARVAAVACAFYPALVQASLVAMSELQYASLTALGTCCLFGVDQRRSTLWVFCGGAFLGLAALTRGNGLLLWLILLVAYPAYVLWSYSPEVNDGLLMQSSLLAAGFLLAISPWMVRNFLLLNDWVPIATSGGANMWFGHHPGSDGLLGPDTRPGFPHPPDELVWSEYGFRNSLKYWISHPIENLKIGARIVAEIIKVDSGAFGLIFQDGRPAPRWLYLTLWGIFNLFYYAIWFCGVFWFVARATGRWVARGKPGILLFIAMAYILTYVPFIGRARFKIPALPFLIAVASIVVVGLAMTNCRVDATRSGKSAERPEARTL